MTMILNAPLAWRLAAMILNAVHAFEQKYNFGNFQTRQNDLKVLIGQKYSCILYTYTLWNFSVPWEQALGDSVTFGVEANRESNDKCRTVKRLMEMIIDIWLHNKTYYTG